MAPRLGASRDEIPHLDPAAMARLRASLRSERTAQSVLADDHETAVSELTDEGGIDSVERQRAVASAARARELIEALDHALARMDAGTYGMCQTCRGPIPIERLDAIPHARSCVGCRVSAGSGQNPVPGTPRRAGRRVRRHDASVTASRIEGLV